MPYVPCITDGCGNAVSVPRKMLDDVDFLGAECDVCKEVRENRLVKEKAKEIGISTIDDLDVYEIKDRIDKGHPVMLHTKLLSVLMEACQAFQLRVRWHIEVEGELTTISKR